MWAVPPTVEIYGDNTDEQGGLARLGLSQAVTADDFQFRCWYPIADGACPGQLGIAGPLQGAQMAGDALLRSPDKA